MKGQHSQRHEIRTIRAMVRIWCKNRHHSWVLCEDCRGLLDYAEKRIDRCVFGKEKPACKDCTVHCYSPKMRDKVREVMRYSGPRMIWIHPVMAIRHLLK